MKRVIDVSDTLYQTCIRLVSEGDPRPSESCIANSEPYEPLGDCVSREALIKTVEKEEGISWDSHGKDDLCVRKKYIDNAPTVDAIVNTIEVRPQGKWTNKHFEHADCSLCGRTNDYHGDFCKYCGADMRGDAV